MGIRDEYAKTKADLFWEQFPILEDQLIKGRIKVSRVPGKYLVRTYCEVCDEAVHAIKQHGQRLLIIAVGDRWFLHQCPQPNEPNAQEQTEDEQQRDGAGEPVSRYPGANPDYEATNDS